MKEHKFKVWDKENEKWLEIGGDIFLYYSNGKFEVIEGNEHYAATIENVEIVQYTGLMDKECEEIYGGYIVEIAGHKYIIKFEIGSFMLVRCSDKTDMSEQFENSWNDDVYPLSQYHWDSNADEDILYNCEIIGNIYENPDLVGE